MQGIDPSLLAALMEGGGMGGLGLGGPPANSVTRNAGVCEKRGSQVYADPRKGKLTVSKSPQGFVEFEWKERKVGGNDQPDMSSMMALMGGMRGRQEQQPESENNALKFTIFPGMSVTFEGPIPECKTGRVFLLRFVDNNRLCFFWSQESTRNQTDAEIAKSDRTFVRKVNKLLRGEELGDSDEEEEEEETDQSGSGSGSNGNDGSSGSNSGEQSNTNADDQPAQPGSQNTQQGGNDSNDGDNTQGDNAPSQSGGAQPAAPSDANAQLLHQYLQQFLMNSNPLLLTDVLSSSRVAAVLEKGQINTEELCKQLPEGAQNEQELIFTLSCPQFVNCLQTMQSLLNSPSRYHETMAQFGLDAALSDKSGVAGFLEVLQKTTVASA
ncbi:MAG: hypothetical protein MHM6MM_000095 [Cercozoa sp. M6MM]